MLSSSIYLFTAKVFGYGIRIILPVFLVRLLTKEDFGAYSQFFLLEITIHTIFQMGINQSLFYFIPRDRENAGAYLLNSLLLNTVVFSLAYTLIWFFQADIAREMGMPIIHKFFWYLAGYTMLMMLNVAIVSYLSARQQIVQASIFHVLREILASIATLSAAFYYRDLEKIFLALIISRGITLVIGVAYIHFRHDGLRAQRYFTGIRNQVTYGLVLGLGGTVGTLAMRIHEMTVSRYFDIETYAVYAAGCKQIPILQFFGQSISAVALAQFATMEKNGDWEGVRTLWNKILGTMYGVGLPLALILLLVSRPLVTLMFTHEYADAVPIFRFNTIALLSLMLNSTLVLRAMDRNDVTLKINLAMLALLPFALYGGMKFYGLTGIIAVHALFMIANRLIAHTVLNRLAPVYLSYVASFRNMGAFYAGAFRKATSFVETRLGRT